jgi:hypothetical protein
MKNFVLSTRQFKVWSYSVSHKMLIIRSPLKSFDMEGYELNSSYNIDVEFYGVAYINLPTSLCILDIVELDIHNLKEYELINPYNRLFEIKSKCGVYHILADGFVIGKNEWISDDRISNLTLKYDEIIGSS